MQYIWQKKDWPNFYWSTEPLESLLQNIPLKQGMLLGQMRMAGLEDQNQLQVTTLSKEIQQSGEIEGESLALLEVRSSIASRLGVEDAGIPSQNRQVEGTVELILDAVRNFEKPLTEERMLLWHGSLFPMGQSGIKKMALPAFLWIQT
jgi:Fic family protein